MPIPKLAFVFLTALLASLLVLPRIYQLCSLVGGIDRPDSERKTHSSAVPRLGGVALFAGVLVPLLIYGLPYSATAGFLAGAAIIFFVGLVDDIQQITPLQKLAGQVVGTSVGVAMSGAHLASLGDLFGLGEILLPEPFAIPLTVFCVVGIINAINMIDGLDGLAAGVSAIATSAFVVIALENGAQDVMVIGAAVVGAALGFLSHNTHPARMFMGDSGSNLLGYSLGMLAVALANAPGKVSPVAPLLVLMLPVVDTLFVMGRRIVAGKSPFTADRTHMHHRLLDLGMGHRGTVLTVYGVSYAMAAAGVTLHAFPDRQLMLVFAVAVWVVYLGVLFVAGRIFPTVGLGDDSPFFTERIIALLQESSSRLLTVARYLLLGVLVVSAAATIPGSSPAGFTAMALAAGIIFSLARRNRGKLLIPLIHLSGIYIIFQTENHAVEHLFGKADLNVISVVLFVSLAVIIGVKIFLRKRLGEIIATPFEHGLFMILLFIPLLPEEIASEYRLPAVAIKSMILAATYKLVLIRDEPRRNRLVIAATVVSLLVIFVRGVI